MSQLRVPVTPKLPASFPNPPQGMYYRGSQGTQEKEQGIG